MGVGPVRDGDPGVADVVPEGRVGPAVVLATGENYPDALAGVPLATEKGRRCC
ncbi:cell wall-binding repeat-containing protein [Catenulispora yoronensis]